MRHGMSGKFLSSCSSWCSCASSYRCYPLLPSWEAHFSVGVFFDGTLHAAVHVRGRVSFCTTLYVTVRYCTVLKWLGFHEFLIQSNPLSLDTFRRLPLLVQAHQHLACEWLRSGPTFVWGRKKVKRTWNITIRNDFVHGMNQREDQGSK